MNNNYWKYLEIYFINYSYHILRLYMVILSSREVAEFGGV